MLRLFRPVSLAHTLPSHVQREGCYRWFTLCVQGADSDSKLIGDIAYEVDCGMIIVKEGEVNIGTYSLYDPRERANTSAGGNPSAEEAEEALENGAEQVNNVVHSFRLQSTSFDKKVSLAVPCLITAIDAIVLLDLPQGLHEGRQDLPPGEQPGPSGCVREGCSGFRQEDCGQL